LYIEIINLKNDKIQLKERFVLMKHNIDSGVALSYLFTPSILKDLIDNQYSSKLIKIFTQFNIVDSLYQNLSLRELFENSYKQLLKSYRNEYIFKNAIAQKILIGRHSIKSSSLFTEFRVETSKADVVIFNGTSHVYEIKTDLDNFERLEKQINNYKKVFEYVNVVSVESKIDIIKSLVDDSVGIIVLTDKYTLKTIRKAKSGLESIEKEAIFNILRKSEYLNIINDTIGYIPNVPNTKIHIACKKLFITLSIKIIQKEVLKTLKNRKNHKNLIDNIKEFPTSLKVAILEADLTKEQQSDFLELLNQQTKFIFKKGLNNVSSVS
jgi:hypothetical protein